MINIVEPNIYLNQHVFLNKTARFIIYRWHVFRSATGGGETSHGVARRDFYFFYQG
jgi:hypothetical protein